MARGPYSARDLPAARAFLDSVYSSGGIRRGRGAKAPADLSGAQVVRYANALRRQAIEGRPLSLTEARRGTVVSPRTGERLPAPERRAPRELGPYREAIMFADPAALLRYARGLPGYPDLRYSLRVNGVLTDAYAGVVPEFVRRSWGTAREITSWRTLAVGDMTDFVGATARDLLGLAAGFGIKRPVAWELVWERPWAGF